MKFRGRHTRWHLTAFGAPDSATHRLQARVLGYTDRMLLILGIILLVIAIAGGAIVHPILFALAIVAIVLFFMGRGRATV